MTVEIGDNSKAAKADKEAEEEAVRQKARAAYMHILSKGNA